MNSFEHTILYSLAVELGYEVTKEGPRRAVEFNLQTIYCWCYFVLGDNIPHVLVEVTHDKLIIDYGYHIWLADPDMIERARRVFEELKTIRTRGLFRHATRGSNVPS